MDASVWKTGTGVKAAGNEAETEKEIVTGTETVTGTGTEETEMTAADAKAQDRPLLLRQDHLVRHLMIADAIKKGPSALRGGTVLSYTCHKIHKKRCT